MFIIDITLNHLLKSADLPSLFSCPFETTVHTHTSTYIHTYIHTPYAHIHLHSYAYTYIYTIPLTHLPKIFLFPNDTSLELTLTTLLIWTNVRWWWSKSFFSLRAACCFIMRNKHLLLGRINNQPLRWAYIFHWFHFNYWPGQEWQTTDRKLHLITLTHLS